MAGAPRSYIANQIFVGLPWKNVRPRYERIISKLETKYPVYFTIVGRNDGQDAVGLFEVIKQRIESSSSAIFDATGGNANVSLEYGYAEGKEIPRSIFLSVHAASSNKKEHPIISDLSGHRRVQYKTEGTLAKELHKLCQSHDYTKRFELALKEADRSLKKKGLKKRARSLGLKLIRQLDGVPKVRRAEITQAMQAQKYSENEIDWILKRFHEGGILHCSQGRYSDVTVA